MKERGEDKIAGRNKGLITNQARTVIHKSKKNYTRKNKHKNKDEKEN